VRSRSRRNRTKQQKGRKKRRNAWRRDNRTEALKWRTAVRRENGDAEFANRLGDRDSNVAMPEKRKEEKQREKRKKEQPLVKNLSKSALALSRNAQGEEDERERRNV